jgi:5'-nucleotidase
MTSKMHILLTNDDGFHADGIQTLYSYLKDKAQVSIVAPDRERSATGHAITMHQPLRITCKNESLHHWMVDGTPADCVKLAVEYLLQNDPPDLIISGINRGPNLGNDVLYSGTVSAAIEGFFCQIPSLAVSLAGYGRMDFTPAADFIAVKVEQLRDLADNTVLNINFPLSPIGGLYQGVKFTTLGKRIYRNVFEARQDLRGQTYFWLGGDLVKFDQTADSDIQAIEEGYVSITPLNPDLTDYRYLQNRQVLFD